MIKKFHKAMRKGSNMTADNNSNMVYSRQSKSSFNMSMSSKKSIEESKNPNSSNKKLTDTLFNALGAINPATRGGAKS